MKRFDLAQTRRGLDELKIKFDSSLLRRLLDEDHNVNDKNARKSNVATADKKDRNFVETETILVLTYDKYSYLKETRLKKAERFMY